MKDCNYFTLWFAYGRYEVVQIVEANLRLGRGYRLNGLSVTVQLKHCYGVISDKRVAMKAARCADKIHKLHQPVISAALTAHKKAVKERNEQVITFLKGLK